MKWLKARIETRGEHSRMDCSLVGQLEVVASGVGGLLLPRTAETPSNSADILLPVEGRADLGRFKWRLDAAFGEGMQVAYTTDLDAKSTFMRMGALRPPFTKAGPRPQGSPLTHIIEAVTGRLPAGQTDLFNTIAVDCSAMRFKPSDVAKVGLPVIAQGSDKVCVLDKYGHPARTCTYFAFEGLERAESFLQRVAVAQGRVGSRPYLNLFTWQAF